MNKELNPKEKVLLMHKEGKGNKLKLVKDINKRGKIVALPLLKHCFQGNI